MEARDADTASTAAAALHAAAERVRRSTDGWGARALSTPAARARLDDIVEAAATGRRLDLEGEDATTAEKALCRRLIDLLRRELLVGDDRPPGPTAVGAPLPGPRRGHAQAVDGALFGFLRRLEEMRAELEPEWHESLAAGLTGLDALDLLIEVAHDLRSPLTSIMFLAETLRRSPAEAFGDVERQQLGIIYSAALNLSGVASDLIDLARGDTYPAAAAEAAAPFSVANLLERIRGMVAPMAEEKGLELVFTGPSDDGRIGDTVALSRILLNLTTNALKFTDAGRIEVRVRDIGGERVEFSVTDTGRGMDEAAVATLFEPFRRSRSRSGFRFSGTGLGLAISRRILELMGSALQVDTSPGVGSRFYFELHLPIAEGK